MGVWLRLRRQRFAHSGPRDQGMCHHVNQHHSGYNEPAQHTRRPRGARLAPRVHMEILCFCHRNHHEPVESMNLCLNGTRPVRVRVRRVTVVGGTRRDVARRVEIRKSPRIAIGLPRLVGTTGGLPRCDQGVGRESMAMEGVMAKGDGGREAPGVRMVCCGAHVSVRRLGMSLWCAVLGSFRLVPRINHLWSRSGSALNICTNGMTLRQGE